MAGYTEIATFRLQEPPSSYLRGNRIVYLDRRDLAYGRRYTYVATTTDAQGRTSPPSARVSITYVAPPAAPQALRAEPGDHTARLSWQPSTRLVVSCVDAALSALKYKTSAVAPKAPAATKDQVATRAASNADSRRSAP